MRRACLGHARSDSHRAGAQVAAVAKARDHTLRCTHACTRGQGPCSAHTCCRSCFLTGLSITRRGSSATEPRPTGTAAQHGEAKSRKRKGFRGARLCPGSLFTPPSPQVRRCSDGTQFRTASASLAVWVKVSFGRSHSLVCVHTVFKDTRMHISGTHVSSW